MLEERVSNHRHQRMTMKAVPRPSLNAEPVDPAIRTTHMGHSIVECEVMTGT